jgi:Zn finger protein HypA/HybF involved in hydrogenase expression
MSEKALSVSDNIIDNVFENAVENVLEYVLDNVQLLMQYTEFQKVEKEDLEWARKKVANGRFLKNCGFGKQWYRHELVCVRQGKSITYYLIILEAPDHQELIRLSKHCRCPYHRANPICRLLINRVSVGCLKSKSWSNKSVQDARLILSASKGETQAVAKK